MKTFELTDVNGQKVTLTEEALAGLTPVPEGSVVIKQTDLTELQGQVTSLSSQMETMATATAAAEKSARAVQLKAALDGMSRKALITLAQRQYAEKRFADAVDLSEFTEWAATFTSPIIKLNTDHGSGLDAPAMTTGQEAGDRLLTLANKIQKEKRIEFRDALILASKQEPESAESYREGFASLTGL